jgi:hypothetical protein
MMEIRIGREFILDAQINVYVIKDVMLYLGSNINISLKKIMGNDGKTQVGLLPDLVVLG